MFAGTLDVHLTPLLYYMQITFSLPWESIHNLCKYPFRLHFDGHAEMEGPLHLLRCRARTCAPLLPCRRPGCHPMAAAALFRRLRMAAAERLEGSSRVSVRRSSAPALYFSMPSNSSARCSSTEQS